MKKFIAGLVLSSLCVGAQAEFLNGNQLYQRILSTEVGDRFYALGYIVGAYDMGVHVFFCPKTETGITAGQVFDIVKNYIAANPGLRQHSADRMVRDAFKQVWPCPNRSGTRL